MRALTAEEVRKIVAGLAKAANTLTTVTVTGHRPAAPAPSYFSFPPSPSYASPLPGGGGGGGGGGIGSDHVTTEVEKEIAKAIFEEIQVYALKGEDPMDLVKTGLDWAQLSASLLNQNIAGGYESWAMYNSTGSSPNPGLAYINTPINWNNVDWSLFAGNANTYDDALRAMQQYYSVPRK